MNYTELSARIQAYAENDFPASAGNLTSAQQIATFVQQAEDRIYNAVQIPALRKNVTGTLTVNNKYLSCPADFLSVYSLAVIDATGSYEYLLNKDVKHRAFFYSWPNTRCKLHGGNALFLLPRVDCYGWYKLAWRQL